MSVTHPDVLHGPVATERGPRGPITAARQRRTAIFYGLVFMVGLMPLLTSSPAWLQALGLGLWIPGGGFAAVGGWAIALFPLTLVLFAVSVVAWFWAGAVTAPLLVWLASAFIAAAMTGPAISTTGPVLVPLAMAGVAAFFVRRSLKRQEADLQKAAFRKTYLAESVAEVAERAAVVPAAEARELAPDQIASVRYVLDRALQPLEEWGGFDIIDQFQPAALRYQINHLGFALGLVHANYTPAFHSYMVEAQRKLIDKYRLPKVWTYWIYESCWGHLNFTNHDPAAKDNIMLTGWYGMHVGLYMKATGDLSYAEPGALTFRQNEKTAYTHDFHTIVRSVVDNLNRAPFCLYPCEPNWVYPICNHYGMSALASHDALFGTRYVADILPAWLDRLDTEFTDQSGSIIGLRSELTGIEFPFPTGEAGYVSFANTFAPERARRMWAIARGELAHVVTKDAEGNDRITLPSKGIDAGNYTLGNVPAYGTIMLAAREFGDDALAEAAQRSLDQDGKPTMVDGVLRYAAGSNLANAVTVQGRVMRTGDYRRAFIDGPGEAVLKGPRLKEASYPQVLVARAWGRGEDLELTLYPGAGDGEQTLGLDQLVPGRTYTVTGATASSLTADPDGRASLNVALSGRTEIRLVPAS